MLRSQSPAAADLLGPPPASPAALGAALSGVAARLGEALRLQACLLFLAEPGEPALVLAAGVGVEAALSWEWGGPEAAHLPGETAWVPIEADGRRQGGLLLAWPAAGPAPEGTALAAEVARGLSPWLAGRLPSALRPSRADLAGEAPHEVGGLAALYEVAKALSSRLEREEILEMVARLAASVIRARGAVLRLLAPEDGMLTAVATAGVGAMEATRVPLPLGVGISGTVAREGIPLLVPPGAVPSGSAGLTPLLCVPLTLTGRSAGTLTLFGKVRGEGGEADQFITADVTLLQTLASQGAVAIQNAALLAEAREKTARLEALTRLTQQVTATLDRGRIIDAILDAVHRLSPGALVRLWLREAEGEALALAGARGFRDLAGGAALRFGPGEGLTGVVVKSGRPEVVLDLRGDPRFVNRAWAESEGLVSFAGLPLLAGDRLVGVLGLFTRSPRTFTPEETSLLGTFAAQAAIALENARRFAESQQLAAENFQRYREIAVLHEISAAMQRTVTLDRLLHTILTGVTFGGGLGFNRACLLLVNERGDVLEGRMGVGPADAEEAGRIWQALSVPGAGLASLLANEEAFRALESSPLTALVRSLRVPLRPGSGLLAEAVLTRQIVEVADAAADPRVHPTYEGRLGAGAFAVAPLIATDRVVGALVVDNKFSGRLIGPRDLDFLELVAAQAGLAVEHALLVERLEGVSREVQQTHHQLVRQERLVVLGEMAANMVHEIRNPLTAIGGFARRLRRRLGPQHPERATVEVIAREVDRLERITRDVLGLARGLTPSPAAVDLGEVVEDCLLLFPDSLARQRVTVVREFAPEPVRAWADLAQLKQVVLNLLYNALEAMPHGGTLTLRTGGEPGWASLTVADTGPGIPPAIRESIFDPFFTTKPEGTGLGLTLAHRLVQAHGGRLEVESHPGQGSAFWVWLPVPPAGGGGTA
ncbi:MAG: GAF domain-containing protein [candidate division NC10 bacterium]|nr:GAF domain-containing protein [candidate division NC10 bacterium]